MLFSRGTKLEVSAEAAPYSGFVRLGRGVALPVVQYRYLLLVGRWQKRMEMGRTTPPNIFSYHPQEAKNVK